MARNWKKFESTPQDILDGAKTLDRCKPVLALDLVSRWTTVEEYMSWARTALEMANPFGYDAAVCYAKRAVCRLIDSLMHYNHFNRWAGETYPAKIDLLRKIGVEIKGVTYDLIIDGRNDIEHNYSGATEKQASHAVEVAELTVPSLIAEASSKAIVTLGWNYGLLISGPDRTAEGGYSNWNYALEADVPFLLVDYVDFVLKVMIIYRKDEEARYARLDRFEKSHAIELSKQLREQISCNGRMYLTGDVSLVGELKSKLELSL